MAGNRQKKYGPGTSPASPQGSHAGFNAPRAAMLVASAFIAFVVVIVHLPNLQHALTNWDDNVNISANPLLNPVSFRNVARFWTEPYANLYVPLTYTTWAAERAAFGAAAWPQFLGNLLLHCGSALMLFRLILRLIPRDLQAHRVPAALLGALLFALHPVQVESVAWATGRKDTLSGFLVLAALLLYVRAAQSSSGADALARLRRPAWWAAQAAFVAAILAKPSAVTFPALAFALDWLALGTTARVALASAAPPLAISALAIALTATAQPIPEALQRHFTPLWTRPFIAADALLFYMRKIVWPTGLGANYGRTPAVVMAGSRALLPLTLLATAAAAVVITFTRLKRRVALRPSLVFAGLLLAFLALTPVLGLVPFIYQSKSTVGDRYLYIPMAGAAIALAMLWRRAAIPATPRSRWAPLSGATALLILYAALSVSQAGTWRNSFTLWTRAVQVAPQAPANRTNLASALLDLNRPAAALAATDEAIRLDPENFAAQSQRSIALLQLGRNEEAIAAAAQAVALAPNDAGVYQAQGDILLKSKQSEAAVLAYQKALALDPTIGPVHRNLAIALSALGRYAEAVPHFEFVLAERPDLSEDQARFGFVLARLGRTDEALVHLREALRLDPRNALATEQLKRLEKSPPADTSQAE